MSDSAEKNVQILDLENILYRFADLINTDCGFIQHFCSDVDFACNLVRILDCDFIVELLMDPNLDRALSDFASNLDGSADLYTPTHPPPPPFVVYCKEFDTNSLTNI